MIGYSKNSLFQTESSKKQITSTQVISVNTNIKLKPINDSLITLVFTQFDVSTIKKTLFYDKNKIIFLFYKE
jgi:hypothetical protein